MTTESTDRDQGDILWHTTTVTSPQLSGPVRVVAATDIPYVPGANRFQNLQIYLPHTAETSELIGRPVTTLPRAGEDASVPRYLVHIHGGAWRDPRLTSRSIEATAAHAFSRPDAATPLHAIASLNYTLSPFPTHPTLPYDPASGHHRDSSREAVHPEHLADILRGFALLRSLGLTDGSYVLSGHSAGACLGFQATLVSPTHHGLTGFDGPPRPAAQLGLNGLYDLPDLVDGLDPAHARLRNAYRELLSHAFGSDPRAWSTASPTRFDPTLIARRVSGGTAPPLILLDASIEDELVPANQKHGLAANLRKITDLQVLDGHRCTGSHAAPWEQGSMIWQSLMDTLHALSPRARKN